MYPETTAGLGVDPEPGAAGFARFMVRLAEAQGDRATADKDGDSVIVQQEGWTLMHDVPEAGAVLLDCWAGLLEGAAMAHDHRLVLQRHGLVWQVRTLA